MEREELPFKIGDKVFVSDWGKLYNDFYRWNNSEKTLIWGWKTSIPTYTGTDFHWKTERAKLTKAGTPYKRPYDAPIISRTPVYKDYEYEILEIKKNNSKDEFKDYVCLLSSLHTDVELLKCFVQVGMEGLTTLTKEERKVLSKLEKTNALQALAKQNLGKWSIENDLKQFPKELLKYLYDQEQRTCFGSDYPNTKAIIKYPYIPKEYTKKGNDLCLGWEQEFNGVGCDLTDKDTIKWSQLKERFPENSFEK